MDDRGTVVERQPDRHRHPEPVGHVLLADAAVEHERRRLVHHPADVEVDPVGGDVDAVHPLIEEPPHRLAERLGDRVLERARGHLAPQVGGDVAAHQLPEPGVVAGLPVEQHRPQHVEDVGALLVDQDAVVDARAEARLGRGEPIADGEGARLVPLGPPQRLGAEAVVPEPDALAHLSLPQHVEAPRVHHLRELVGVVQAVQRIEGGRVVGEALRHPLVAVVPPPVDPGAPPLVRHLVGAEHLRLSRVHGAEGLVRQEQQAGKGLPAQGLGLGDEQRRVGERSEVIGEELDGAGHVGDGPLPAVRREPAVVGVGVDGDGGGVRALDLGHLELAVVEGHAADRPVRRPALGAGVVLDALVEQGPPAGDAVPLGHPEGRLEAAGAVVGVLRPPVQGVEEHEVAGLPEPIDERSLVGELEDERLAGGDGAGQRHRHPGLEVVVLEGPFLALLREGQRLAGQRRRFRGVRVGVGRLGRE